MSTDNQGLVHSGWNRTDTWLLNLVHSADAKNNNRGSQAKPRMAAAVFLFEIEGEHPNESLWHRIESIARSHIEVGHQSCILDFWIVDHSKSATNPMQLRWRTGKIQLSHEQRSRLSALISRGFNGEATRTLKLVVR